MCDTHWLPAAGLTLAFWGGHREANIVQVGTSSYVCV